MGFIPPPPPSEVSYIVCSSCNGTTLCGPLCNFCGRPTIAISEQRTAKPRTRKPPKPRTLIIRG